MRISDWSSDVCSSDLKNLKVADFASEETMCFSATVVFDGTPIAEARNDGHGGSTSLRALNGKAALLAQAEPFANDRKSVEEGKSVSVRVTLGGRGMIKKKIIQSHRDRANTKKS